MRFHPLITDADQALAFQPVITIQALAHLLAEKAAGRADRPSLAIAPTSLMFNWKREAERFAPSLRVVILQGPKRHEHFDRLGEQDLVLTTYALLPRDLEVLIAQGGGCCCSRNSPAC